MHGNRGVEKLAQRWSKVTKAKKMEAMPLPVTLPVTDSDDIPDVNESGESQPSDNSRSSVTSSEGPVKINVGGKVFQISRGVLRKYPETKLGQLDALMEEHYVNDSGEFFFDRNPKVFQYIVNYYRTGQLHVPQNLCGPTIKLELDYWQIDDTDLSPCCWKAYQQFDIQEKAMQLVDSYFGNTAEDVAQMELHRRGKQRMRLLLWNFLDDPSSSLPAKLFAILFSLLLILSVSILFFDSMQGWRVTKTQNYTQPWLNVTGNPKLMMVFTTDPHPALTIIEDILTVFFLVEFLLRFMVAIRKLQFLSNMFNIVDLCGIVPMTIRFIIDKSTPQWWNSPPLYWVYSFLRIGGVFRVLRLVKLGSLVFSVSVYLCEIWNDGSNGRGFDDLLDGTWWAMITMTTVGYGDIYPVTHQGRVVGIFCALAGIIATGLPVPIIANNFDRYYGYAKMCEEAKKSEKERRQKDLTIKNVIQETFSSQTTSQVTTKITVVKSINKNQLD